MKTLLIGGPLDGKVVDTSKTTFEYGEVIEIHDKTGLVQTKDSGRYVQSYQKIKHPAKKKGTVRVFVYYDGKTE